MTDQNTIPHLHIHNRVQELPPQAVAKAEQVMANTIDNGTGQVWLGVVIDMHPLVYRMEIEQAINLRAMLDQAIEKSRAGVN